MKRFPLIFERSVRGRKGISVPQPGVPESDPVKLWGPELAAAEPPSLPELSENEVVRHFTRLSQRNAGIDTTFYPLGSCTMKYNPRVNEAVARLAGFCRSHPLSDEFLVQGNLELLESLGSMLCALTGMDAISLQPAAGAQGEITGLMIIKKALASSGRGDRDEVLVPDASHGTNPASGALVGFKVKEVKSNSLGRVDLEDLKKHLSPRTAGLMLTNPNTLGLFETEIKDLAAAVHAAGAYLYCDGANFNALVGRARPGDMGFDVMHLNLHKTFSTPHGGGGPGAGPVAVKKELERFLPSPRPIRKKDGTFGWDRGGPDSVGRVSLFHGNFGNLVRAYTYIRAHSLEDLRGVSGDAVLNANYLRSKVSRFLDIPHGGPCMHEFVASAKALKEKTGISTLDLAKGLIDAGYHPPTIYFPLIVAEALMIEPTETEGKETLEAFAQALEKLVAEAASNPAGVKAAPQKMPVGRLDEVGAARNPDVRYAGESKA